MDIHQERCQKNQYIKRKDIGNICVVQGGRVNIGCCAGR